MADLSNDLETKLINQVLRNTAYTRPTTVYAALYTSDPTDADVGTEVTGGSYARQSVAFDAPSDGTTDNTSDVTFPTATAAWGTVTHVGLRDASSGGNLLFHSPLADSRVVNNGDTFKFNAGDLDASLA